MKVYLAARYSRHPEMQSYAKQLAQHGIDVTSRWIAGNHTFIEETPTGEVSSDQRAAERLATEQRFATEDIEDLDRADWIVNFTEGELRKNCGRGGRHAEFGYAYAKKKNLLIVGPREHVFHSLPGVLHFTGWERAIGYLLGVAYHENGGKNESHHQPR
jgi:nucleoside 2-deoxyribosyltransferase